MDAELLRGLVADLTRLHRCVDGMNVAIGEMSRGEAKRIAATAANTIAAIELSVAQGQGFVMVPREPTYQMAEAMGVKWESGEGFPRRYTAMLAAAPAQPDGVE